MSMLLLIGLLLLNVLISVWNCYVVGVSWKDVKAFGGAFEKGVLWCAIIQSGVGFSMPLVLGLTWGSVAILTGGTEPTLTPAQGKEMMEAVFNLWYIAVVFPVLGSGFVIWVYSIREAYRNRDFTSIAAAGWNSYAQVSNMIDAYHQVGGAFGNVWKLFGKAFSGEGDGKAKVAWLVILIVVISLVGGFLIAFGLVRYFARTTQSRLEEYADTLHPRRTAHA